MSNILLAYDNATYGAINTSIDGWASYADFAPLKTTALAHRWQSAGLATADMRITTFGWVGAPSIACIVLANHNLTLAATVRIMASNDPAFGTLVYDSGTVGAFAAGVTAASRAGLRWNFVHRLSAPAAAAYWRIEMSDAANPAGFLAIGRLAGFTSIWQPTINMSAGAGIAWESPSEAQQALSGAEWFIDREPFRTMQFKVDHLTTADAMGGAFDLQRVAAGARREVWLQYDPSDGVHSVRRSLFGRLRKLSAIEEPYVNGHTTAFEVKELI